MEADDRNTPINHIDAESGVTSQEVQICTVTADYQNDVSRNTLDGPINTQPGNFRTSLTSLSYISEMQTQRPSVPLLYINKPASVVVPVTSQPLRIASNPPSPISIVMPNQPQTLFLQALSRLNESSISLAVVNNLRNLSQLTLNDGSFNKITHINPASPELTPPNSLTSAPPSYSFVLRQMAMRRRPRLMGTFIPSPSFVQHTPPPNYAAAFDIYVDNPIPPPPRVYHFGFTPMPIVCPECGYTGLTLVTSKITICTHLCAIILCVFCCWICVPLPYVLRSCKDVYHYCRNCRNFLGMYCPTNPEHSYP